MSELVLDVWKTGPPPASGQRQRYPGRFWHNFQRAYPGIIERVHGEDVVLCEGIKFLHMFSGSMKWGTTTDIRKETGADIIAPYDNLPIPDESFDVVASDSPYADFFAREWTSPRNFPIPKRILIEAARVTKPGGLIAILHIIKIRNWKEANVEWIGGHSILCGDNNTVRFLNVFRKRTRAQQIMLRALMKRDAEKRGSRQR